MCGVCGKSEGCSCVEQYRKGDLPALIRERTALFGRGYTYRGACPIHGGSNRNLAVYYKSGEDTWYWKCHNTAECGAGGDIYDWLQQVHGMSFVAALAHLANVPIQPMREPTYTRPARAPSAGLDVQTAMSYHNALGAAQRDWWHARGVSDATIDRFMLGWCARCPTAYNPDDPDWHTSSYTIPVFDNGKLVNIRHRLEHPFQSGDKYRPQASGLGACLFGIDELHAPDAGDSVLIVEGEIKKIVLSEFGFDATMPVITSTAGAGSWLGSFGDGHMELLDPFTFVYVLFDPDARQVAAQTARLFGRRGYVIDLDEKIDDFLLARGDDGVRIFCTRMEYASCPAQESYWKEIMQHERAARYRPTVAPWDFG